MKSMTIVMITAAVMLVVCGCGDSGISYPTGDGGWQVGLTLSQIPRGIAGDSVVISVQGDAINLTTGERSPDGDILVFCTSGGIFQNGMSEIELATIDGRATAELVIDSPGTYQVEVTYPEESCSASWVFSIGLE